MFEQILEYLDTIPGEFAFGGVIVVLLLCGLGFPLPEEFPLFAAGYLAQQGVVSLRTSIIGCFAAIVAGDCMLFAIGYRLGNRIFELPPFQKLLTPERMKRVNDRFRRYGSRVVFVGRFMAGVRATVFLAAGTLRMPFRRFIILDGMAAAISVPILIWIAYTFGDEIDQALKMIRKTGLTLFLVIGTVVILATLVIVRMRKAREPKAPTPNS